MKPSSPKHSLFLLVSFFPNLGQTLFLPPNPKKTISKNGCSHSKLVPWAAAPSPCFCPWLHFLAMAPLAPGYPKRAPSSCIPSQGTPLGTKQTLVILPQNWQNSSLFASSAPCSSTFKKFPGTERGALFKKPIPNKFHFSIFPDAHDI